MKASKILLLITFMAGFASVATATEAKKVFKRSGAWAVNYAEDQCHLVGTFESNGQRALLTFTKSDLGGLFDLTLSGEEFRTIERYQPSTLDFGVSNGPVETSWAVGRSGELPALHAEMWFGLDYPVKRSSNPSPEAENAYFAENRAIFDGTKFAPIDHLAMTRPGRADVRFDLTGMESSMAALDACTDDLVSGWGYDPIATRALKKKPLPIGYSAAWAKLDDLPEPLAKPYIGKRVRYLLSLDQNGRVLKCQVTSSSTPPEINAKICGLLAKRARFKPAVDQSGHPTTSYWRDDVYLSHPVAVIVLAPPLRREMKAGPETSLTRS